VKENQQDINASSLADFRRRKFILALGIMCGGMLLALAWNAYQGWGLGKGYPHNTFLFNPKVHFSDLSDMTLISSRPNPYADPTAFYLPFAWVCFRPLHDLPNLINLIGCFFAGLAILFLLLVKALQPVITIPPQRVLYSLLFLCASYPVLMCFDRGNIEIIVAAMIAGAVFFISRSHYALGAICLVPPISLKLYPAFLLVLLLRQRKWASVVWALLVTVAITFLSLHWLSLPASTAWKFYTRNMGYYTDADIYENFTLESSPSPWNAYKIVLIAAGKLGLIHPVNFSFNGECITTSYIIYTMGMALLAIGVVIYACFLEQQFARCAMAVFLYLTVNTPAGGDYRLLYAGMALVLLVCINTKRPNDLVILVLLALSMVPMKEVLLTFAGKTETVFADVSLEVLLSPIFVLAALFLLLYDGRNCRDPRWIRLRWLRQIRVILPWTGRKAFRDNAVMISSNSP